MLKACRDEYFRIKTPDGDVPEVLAEAISLKSKRNTKNSVNNSMESSGRHEHSPIMDHLSRKQQKLEALGKDRDAVFNSIQTNVLYQN